jgi:hypothetical protein
VAIKTVIFRMEPADFDRIEAEWRSAGFKTLQDAGVHAFMTAFRGTAGAIPAPLLPYRAMLDEVLAGGDQDLIELVIKPLEFARKRLRASDGQRKAGKQSR